MTPDRKRAMATAHTVAAELTVEAVMLPVLRETRSITALAVNIALLLMILASFHIRRHYICRAENDDQEET